MKETIEIGMFQDYPDVLTVRDLCRALHIGRVGAYKLLSTGTISGFKVGNAYKVPKISLIAYMNQVCNIEWEKESKK